MPGLSCGCDVDREGAGQSDVIVALNTLHAVDTECISSIQLLILLHVGCVSHHFSIDLSIQSALEYFRLVRRLCRFVMLE